MDYIQKELNEIKNDLEKSCPCKMKSFGKLIRSRLGLLLLKSLEYDITESDIKLLCATELIHNASLLHDDILDNEQKRRGNKTIAGDIGYKTSLLFGNILLTTAIDKLLTINSNKILTLFNLTIKEMCEGELIQQSQLYKIPTIEEYIKKSTLKTAKLFLAEIEGLSIIHNTNNLDLKDFILNYGIAFQINNDLANITESQSDIKNGIYTAPVIYSESTNITPSGIEKTLYLRDNYIEKCLNTLRNLKESIYKKELIGIVKCLKK